jgi:hypothetical protein
MIWSMRTRSLVALLAFVLGLGTVPHRVCERDAGPVWDGEPERTDALAARVDEHVRTELTPASFGTGSRRFDGEWLFGTYTMSAMGFGQVALARPDAREQDLDRMERCLDAMLAESARAYDREGWGEDPMASLDRTRGHVAWLGYAGLALALHRTMRPVSRFAGREEAIAQAIARRFEASPSGLVETYPGETYPVDNAAALGALALHARATHASPPPALARGLQAIRASIDPASGLLAQHVVVDGAATSRGPARGSGTALATYFLAYADEPTSAALWRALRLSQLRTVLGFGAVLEQSDGRSRGDVDSGPVVLGFGVSATGFALGASRTHGDREAFRALYATAHLFGAPYDGAYATGGPLGDAILFAMTTAPRGGTRAGGGA